MWAYEISHALRLSIFNFCTQWENSELFFSFIHQSSFRIQMNPFSGPVHCILFLSVPQHNWRSVYFGKQENKNVLIMHRGWWMEPACFHKRLTRCIRLHGQILLLLCSLVLNWNRLLFKLEQCSPPCVAFKSICYNGVPLLNRIRENPILLREPRTHTVAVKRFCKVFSFPHTMSMCGASIHDATRINYFGIRINMCCRYKLHHRGFSCRTNNSCL